MPLILHILEHCEVGEHFVANLKKKQNYLANFLYQYSVEPNPFHQHILKHTIFLDHVVATSGLAVQYPGIQKIPGFDSNRHH
jgi:hypothetical protein